MFVPGRNSHTKEEELSFHGILVLIKPHPRQKAACGNLPNEQRSSVLKEGKSVQSALSQYCGCFMEES